MNKKQMSSLTSYEIIFILVGTVIGIYLLRATGDVTRAAMQDGWISMLIGGIYPLYIVFIASYIIKKHPKENILALSKKHLGIILGNTLNFIFLLQFILYLSFMIPAIISMLRTYSISQLSPIKTTIILATIAAYAASKGIKTLAKINVIIFYVLLVMIMFSIASLKDASFLNIMPVGGSGVTNILKGVGESFQSYNGIEILLLIHPFAKESVKVKNVALTAVFIIIIIYVWMVFITIYYLGVDIIPLTFWPSIILYNSIHVALFNDFVSVFMLIWTLVFLKSMSNQYFVVSFILKDFIKINLQKICLFILPVIVCLSLLFSSNPKYNDYFSASAVYILLFNIGYVTIIGLLIFIKQKKINNSY